ncbi:hypothetical protein [Legionella maioricensis]|uniref:Uncharacterized protein n=1 Tax=Legionella maioricensis TaxID=2896528 RepID=A0A9X2IDI9_9GAMM|nr:hypothetical protein [Legionella maioricensis]MCL9685582.1 hypothetical protein [Legionella maioricensis]MCL9688915.1 hypothetical protein [Legionella maioricensis]
MKAKVDLSNVNSRITALGEMRNELLRLRVSDESAQDIIDKIAAYRKLSAAISAIVQGNQKLTSQYQSAKGSTDDDNEIKILGRDARNGAARHLAKQQKMAELRRVQEEKENKAIKDSEELFKQFETAVEVFVTADLDTMDDARENLVDLRKKLNSALTEFPKIEERTAYFKNIEKLNEKISRAVTYKEILVAADRYLKATTDTMDGELDSYKKLRNSFHKVLTQLPKHAEERRYYTEQIKGLDQKVTQHKEKTEKLIKEMREELVRLAKANREKVQKLTEEGQSLLPIFLLAAPPEVKKAVEALASDKELLALMEGTEEIKLLLGGIGVQSGMKQITSGVVEEMVEETVDEAMTVVASHGESTKVIPVETQIAVLDSVLNALSKEENPTEKTQQTILAVTFLRKTLQGIQSLQRGDKQYVTFIGQVGEHAIISHLSVRELIEKPEQTISSLVELFLKTPVQVAFTSRKEAETLSLLVNANVPNILADVQKAINQGSIPALTEEARGALTQGVMSGALVKGKNAPVKVETISDVAALMLHTANTGNSKALAPIFGDRAPVIQQQLQKIEKHCAKDEPKPLSQSDMVVVAKEFAALILTFGDAANAKNGPIPEFIGSSVFPNNRLEGPKVALLDSSLDGSRPVDLVTQHLLLNGGIAPISGSVLYDQGPLLIMPPPQPIKDNEKEKARKIQIQQDEAFARDLENEEAQEIWDQVLATDKDEAFARDLENKEAHEIGEQLFATENDAALAAEEQENELVLAREVQKNEAIIKRVDQILDGLAEKIDGIGHEEPEARDEAVSLHVNLTLARNTLEDKLKAGENRQHVQAEFKEWCAQSVAVAMPVLEKDLGWGEYLQNMLKTIANVFIAGAQKLGSTATFFNTSSKSAQAVAETGQELQSDSEPDEGNAPTI